MLKVPGGGGVRPTQDRVRQALFSSLGGAVEGARVLDLFAGTGALGLEAMSRGAASARWVEQNGKVFAILRENVRSICGEDGAKAGCTKEDVPAFLRRGRGESFDLILADPPYEWVERGGAAEGLMEAIREGGWLVEGGVFVLEMGVSRSRGRGGEDKALVDKSGWDLLKDGVYGDTRLLIYRLGSGRNEEESS